MVGPVAHLSWTELQQTVASCEGCALCQQRRHTVFGTGAPEPSPGEAPQVDWMIVGEAPGENEDLQGEPFVGQAGHLLDNMLKAVGLARHAAQAPAGRVYIANVLKCRPPGNRNPQPDEVARCEPYLRRQVALLRPRIIVAMGRFAVQSLLRDSVADVESIPLGRLRGQVYAYEGVPVVVTYHPAYLLRSLIEKRKAWADLCLALSVANRPQG
jgi:DNA polymerase